MTGSKTSIFSTEAFISNAACGSQPTTRNSRFSRFFSSVATAGRCWYLMAIAFVFTVPSRRTASRIGSSSTTPTRPSNPRVLFLRAQERRADEKKTRENFRRGRGKGSPFLLTSLLVCKHCGFKLQGFTHLNGGHRVDGSPTASFSYVCGGYRSKGKSVCKRYRLRRDPFENLILERVEKRLRKYLARGGESVLRKFIQEEILAKTIDPREEIGTVKAEPAALDAEVNRLLDIATPANRDFVDERFGKTRVRKQELEPRLADLEGVDFQPVDLKATTREALAYLSRFREVLG
jgi:recombinase-like zinc beta ribbon protein